MDVSLDRKAVEMARAALGKHAPAREVLKLAQDIKRQLQEIKKAKEKYDN